MADVDYTIVAVYKVRWSPEDSEAAVAEGWDLFSIANGVYEIERVDTPEDGSQPIFENDQAAIAYVALKCLAGCNRAARALTLAAFCKVG